ncbi:MAG: hypothetical protein ACR2KQ_11575 [Actinomycetota bacterium]
MTATLINELREAGLLLGSEPFLSDKGREWLRQLDDVETQTLVKDVETHNLAEDWAADFVLSTSAISR